MKEIIVRGAREHNLKGFDISIPRDRLVVVTGLSGSGKSSLAFDTIYAEGQRRYVESLSAYARQFLEQQPKPDVDSIEGLSPAIAIEQKSVGSNPRSTVGTLTEIYDYLRLLYARIGAPHCHQCGNPISAQTVQQMVDRLLALPERTRFVVLAPLVRGRKGAHRQELSDLRREGFVRVRIDGEMRELENDIQLDGAKVHDVDIVIDRLVIKSDVRGRLTDSMELALAKGEGLVRIAFVGDPPRDELLFAERLACHACGISYPELTPRLFSFNGPQGACPKCDGLGRALEFDEERVIADPDKSIGDGALGPVGAPLGFAGYYLQQVEAVGRAMRQKLDKPWRELTASFRQVVLYGSGEKEFDFTFQSERGSQFSFRRAFPGVIPELGRKLRETTSEAVRTQLEAFMVQRACDACQGTRLRPEALAVKVGGRNIAEVGELGLGSALSFVRELVLTEREEIIAARIRKEIEERLSFLVTVGLGYLTLARGAATLSGGEGQRIRLATQMGSALQGVIYVLDEPSIGLHQRDNDKLLGMLRRLRDVGNTVLVVEHDEDTIRAADVVIDLGPGAGRLGGELVAMGTPQEIESHPTSLTGAYLSGRKHVAVPSRRRPGNGKSITLRGARGHNLRAIDVTLPLGTFVCVTGVSGSGKSTLVTDTLLPALGAALQHMKTEPLAYDRLEGIGHLDNVIAIDQSPIGRTPRSNPATYTGLFAPVRELYAGLPESRARGYKAGRFSFNVKGGRCEACEGDGTVRIEMHFLPDVFVPCDQCQGRRYNRETLEIHYKGKSIADLLEMTVDEAADFLGAVPVIQRKLATLQAVGVGYLSLGQSATTLSGGEAQRVKLSRELAKRSTGRTFYILDEPTTGLHFDDVARLLDVLHELVDGGNTVLVIEHNLDIIKTADLVIDLGPEGGDAGGSIVACGTPEQVATTSASHTGRYLATLLARGRALD